MIVLVIVFVGCSGRVLTMGMTAFYENPGFEKAQYYTFYRKEST